MDADAAMTAELAAAATEPLLLAPDDGAAPDARAAVARLHPEHALLLSHALSAAGWRAFEFAVALILADLFPSSLLFVAAYGLADDGAQVAAGAALGRFVDATERYVGATRCLAAQHVLTAAACGAAYAAYAAPVGSAARAALGACVIAAGVSAGAGALGSTLSIEQDWVVALCAADSRALTRLNARMRAVDLGCLLAAPLAASLLYDYAGAPYTLLVFAGFNAVALLPEAALLRAARAALPALMAPRAGSGGGGGGDDVGGKPAAVGARDSSLLARAAAAVSDPLRLFARQRAALVMLALALLYLTVLSMGYLMTAYLVSAGTGAVVISAFRGAGALAGLSATVAYAPLARRVGLPGVAAGAIAAQLACLAAGALPLLLLLQGGVAASRFGLWLADLAINQLVQETAPPAELGAVQGALRAVCALLEALSYAAALALPDPAHFAALVLGSLAAVALAAVLATRFAVGGVPPLQNLQQKV